ncbi:MAG: sucrose-6-phosphate hydrolase [Bacillota bacterium]|nr:sucrose-6-phosphate hydrolase [Bacillota bacterium]
MKKELVYLDTYTLQRDMRLRLPKAILNNLLVEKGVTKFSIFLDSENNELLLRVCKDSAGEKK